MTPTKGMREEFEKSFWAMYPGASGCCEISEVKDDMEIALWAARWMAEKLCDYRSPSRCEMETPQECRACLMSKELGDSQ